MVNWRQRNIGTTGDILGEKQHKYCMMGIVVVSQRHYDVIMIVVPV
jgi:hypothetical protein